MPAWWNLVDTLVLGTSGISRGGSIPSAGTQEIYMSTDKDRLDWLEKRVFSSGYSTELTQGSNPPFDRVVLNTGVGSGPYQRSYCASDLRGAIDIAMEDKKNV